MAVNYRVDGKPNTLSGSMVIIQIPGLDGADGLIGRGAEWTVTEEFGVTPVNEFGKYGPQEYVYTDYSASATMSWFRILGRPYEALTVDGRPFIPYRQKLGSAIPVDFTFIATNTSEHQDEALWHARYCLCKNKEFSAETNGIVGYNTAWSIVEIEHGEI